MKWGVALATLLGIVALAIAIDQVRGRSATLSWDYDYAKNPPCDGAGDRKSAGTTCVVGFNISLTRPESEREAMPSKAAMWFLSNRFDQNGHVVSKGISTTVPVHLYGNLKFCVAALGKDDMGHSAESLPICMNRWVLPLGIGQR